MEQRHIPKKVRRKDLVPCLKKAWSEVESYIGEIEDEAELEARIVLLDSLLDQMGDDESHPLANFLHLMSRSIEDYEEKNIEIPNVKPQEVLRFLMEQHDLRQTDLKGIIPQSNLSAVLNGKRDITVQQIARLSKRFGVSAEVFIPKIKELPKRKRVA